MFGVGLVELLLLGVVVTMGLGGLAVMYFVVRAAVKAGDRDRNRDA